MQYRLWVPFRFFVYVKFSATELQSLIFGKQGVEVVPAIFVRCIERGEVYRNQFTFVFFQQHVDGSVELFVGHRFRQVINHAFLVPNLEFFEKTGQHFLVLFEKPAANQVARVFFKTGLGQGLNEILVAPFLRLAREELRSSLEYLCQ